MFSKRLIFQSFSKIQATNITIILELNIIIAITFELEYF